MLVSCVIRDSLVKIWELISWGFNLQFQHLQFGKTILHPHKTYKLISKILHFLQIIHQQSFSHISPNDLRNWNLFSTLHPQTLYHLPDQLTKKTHLTPIFSDYSACGPNRFSGSGSTYRLRWDVQGRSCVWVCKCVCVCERERDGRCEFRCVFVFGRVGHFGIVCCWNGGKMGTVLERILKFLRCKMICYWFSVLWRSSKAEKLLYVKYWN